MNRRVFLSAPPLAAGLAGAGLAACTDIHQPQADVQEQNAMQLRVLDVSARLWQVLTQANIEAAAALIDDQAVFVHMGATLDKRQEMDAIAGHKITLKAVDVQEQSARIHGTAAVALKKIRLTAVVGGNEVENPFVVTETCVDKGNGWRLAALAYTRIVH